MEFLTGLFTGILRIFGFSSKEATVVLIGLDNAGKTTLQHKLKTGESYSFVPTQNPREKDIVIGNVTIKTWDLGGHKAVRKLWKQYYRTADAIVFVVDAADKSRFAEARKVLKYILNEEALVETPVAILGNKCDRKEAISMQELKENLGLPKLFDSYRKIKVFKASVVEGYGYPAAFEWLAANLE
uniref:Uncharacterized protein n=1 Tax=Norrisiella sphaerica TaxID=552664 RepID=A0A7S2QSY0_9EUKA|mmetsp:Transcript_2293/g.3264  ORF Transcript_2293/g.3264 Transcript_2293/m.3264 type:complete len:185 (+) Transcript_2293:135-689(+)